MKFLLKLLKENFSGILLVLFIVIPAIILFYPLFIVIAAFYLWNFFFPNKETSNLTTEELEFLDKEYQELSHKKSLSRNDLTNIKGYLAELNPLCETDAKAKDFYQKFNQLITPDTEKQPTRLIQSTPIPKEINPKTIEPPKPVIAYPIIKFLHDPKFTAPPPPNNESSDKGSQEAQSAQYLLDSYIGIFSERPDYKRKLSNREKGSRYERYLGYLYERAGWKVDYNGETSGVLDGGIDLICISRDGEMCHAVQAKHWARRQIDTQDIRKFKEDFEDIRRLIKHPSPQAVFIISSSSFTPEAKELAEEYDITILAQAKMPKSYPLVKCLNKSNGEKIYVLPPIVSTGKYGSGSIYVYLSADFTQGDCYVYTCAEAERLGYKVAR
jgi:Restriction endonuclease.